MMTARTTTARMMTARTTTNKKKQKQRTLEVARKGINKRTRYLFSVRKKQMSSAIDYNAVIKTILIVNEESFWSFEEAERAITNICGDLHLLPYGQVIHIYNVNPGGDELHEFYVVFNGKIVFSKGDQYFLLDYNLTKNITDICAKYPEYQFSDQYTASGFLTPMDSEENCYQMMNGYIRGDDALVKKMFGGILSEEYTVYVDETEVEITKGEDSIKYEYDYKDFSTGVKIEQIIADLA